MKLADVSVKARLLTTVVILGVAMLLVGIFGLRSLQAINDTLISTIDDQMMPVKWINDINAMNDRNLVALDEALLRGDLQSATLLKQMFKESDGKTAALWTRYSATRMAEDEGDTARQYWEALKKFISVRDTTLDELAGGQLDQALVTRSHDLNAAFGAQQKPLEELLNIQNREAEKDRQQSLDHYALARWISIIAIVSGLAIGITLSALLMRSILKALGQAVYMSEQISNGRLGNHIVVESNDEFGRLLRALQSMDVTLSKIVGEVRNSAATVGNAARELATGNDDLSQRTQEQASALEETASSMEQMTATVKQNSDNARQANQLAVSARSQADQGGRVVGNAVRAMNDISDASNRIADIIRVIDEIAFQTNLLALNAAVEAARAGEQGRGFAVVASEVRNLAQRSASAAREIKELIGSSVEKVAAGAALVNESGKTLEDIMTGVKKVADIVAEIAAASEEQAAGIDQVNTAVTQMDSVTQQNAALVEQSSAASKSMEARAEHLVEQIAFFRISGETPVVKLPESEPARNQVIPMSVGKSRLESRSQMAKTTVASMPVKQAANAGDDNVWREF